MPTIANAKLSVEVLDPETDRPRLGPRYCWGGYIWQIHDAQAGTLLTGPEWPKPDPSPFNGQGLPESFRHRTRDGRPHTWRGDRGVAIGGGELAIDAAGEAQVIRPCRWVTTVFAARIEYHTHQQAAGFDYELERKIELAERTVWSISKLTNHSAEPLKLEWFAHPFFALSDRLIQVEFPEGTSIPENPGFTLTGRQLTQMRRFENTKDGHMDSVVLPPGQPLTAKISHPALTHVALTTRFAPSECIIWGNSNTFSIEPYQTLSLEPGEAQRWSLRYDFGEVASAGQL